MALNTERVIGQAQSGKREPEYQLRLSNIGGSFKANVWAKFDGRTAVDAELIVGTVPGCVFRSLVKNNVSSVDGLEKLMETIDKREADVIKEAYESTRAYLQRKEKGLRAVYLCPGRIISGRSRMEVLSDETLFRRGVSHIYLTSPLTEFNKNIVLGQLNTKSGSLLRSDWSGISQ